MGDPGRRARRADLLRSCGAAGGAVDDLLAYGDTPFDLDRLADVALPLPDEPHLAAWSDYASDACDRGVFAALSSRLVQLAFPIETGVSTTPAYLAATRRGESPPPGTGGIRLDAPLELLLYDTLAGRVPILVTGTRADFVSLVRAFACRNEPEPVIDSMGACIVTGFNNWDRVRRHRAAFEAARGGERDEAAWATEFERLKGDKSLYQDRFIILSREPYSGVAAWEVGCPEAEWLDRSLVIRREHECTHYFTWRAFGAMRNNLLDELVADFAGQWRAFGRYDAPMALRFFGLDRYPALRPGGRFELYLGKPPVSAEAATVLRTVVWRAAANLARLHPGADVGTVPGWRAASVALMAFSLDEMVADGLPADVERLVAGRLRRHFIY